MYEKMYGHCGDRVTGLLYNGIEDPAAALYPLCLYRQKGQ